MPVSVELLDADATRGAAALLRPQVTVRSFLGAFVFHSGGAFVDDGWLRVYGSPVGGDDRRLPSLAQVNDFPVYETADPGWRPAAGLVVYGLKPSEFVAARDAYVAQARKAKDSVAVTAITRLRRPSMTAWAANLLARERRREREQFLALGEMLRKAPGTLDAD